MDVAVVHRLVDSVIGVGDDSTDRVVLDRAVGDVARLSGWCQGQQIRLARQIAVVVSFPERALADSAHIGLAAAGRLIERVDTSFKAPALADAVTDGAVSGEHVDALTRVLANIEPERPDLSILTASGVFVAPIPAGPLTIDVEILRAGRSTAQLSADLRVPNVEGAALRVTAVFGATRPEDLAYEGVRCPEVARPDDVATRRHSPTVHFNFDDRTEWRPVRGLDSADGPVLSWERLSLGAPDLLSLVLHSDVLGLAVERLGPFTVLSLQIDIRFLSAPATPWVLQEIEAWHVSDGYASGPARLWDEVGELCAVVNQTAQVRPMHTA